MSSRLKAVIDIGTNSVKLLVARVEGTDVDPTHEESEQTRLGQGFYQEHILQPEPIARTAKAVARLADKARSLGCSSIELIATSAARDARNAHALKQAVQELAGVSPRVITGEEEAELAFRGVITDPQFEGRTLLILDVGGGSTELIAGAGRHHFFRHSFAVGSVRLLHRFPPSDPPRRHEFEEARRWLEQHLQQELSPYVSNLPPPDPDRSDDLVATGGAATILARMERQMTGFDRSQIDGLSLSREKVEQTLQRLWGMTLARRREIVGLPPNRADVILMGLLIYDVMLEVLKRPRLMITTRGLRFGALIGLHDDET